MNVADITDGDKPNQLIDDALFRTKLFAPRGVNPSVDRRRLIEVIDEASVKLFVVRAPAGFGKTTLMQQWQDRLEDGGVAYAWLTLDAADNDPGRLIAALSAAIDQGTGGEGGHIQVYGIDRRLGRTFGLLERLREYGRRFVLLLDDADALHSDGSRAVIRMLIRGTSPSVRIVIAGRAIPSFGQARMRLADLVVTLGVDDLRFSPEETATFALARTPCLLTSAQIGKLQERTEGWIAALQLACLSIKEEVNAGLTPRLPPKFDSDIAEYLHEDVLDSQLPEVRNFLRETSILRLLNGSLCDAITGSTNGDVMLTNLEAKGLFLKRVASDDGLIWYRCHNLFADFLRRELNLSGPKKFELLQKRACEWFARLGLYAEAAEHARAAGQKDRAMFLLDAIAMEHIRRGRLRTVLDWRLNLTIKQARRYEHLFAAYLWAEGFLGDSNKALRLLNGLKKSIAGTVNMSAFMSDTLISLPIMLAGAQLDLKTMRKDGPGALKALTRKGTFEHGALSSCVAYAYVASGDLEAARQTQVAAKAAAQTVRHSYNLAYTQMTEAHLCLCELQPERAISELRYGYQRAIDEYSDFSQSSAIAASFYANVLYETGKLNEARAMLDHHLPMIAETIPDCVVTGYMTAANLAIANKDFSRAREILLNGEGLGLRRKSAVIVRSMRWQSAWLAAISGDVQWAVRHRDDLTAQDATLEAELLSPVDAIVRDLFRLRIDLQVGRGKELINEIDQLVNESDLRQFGRRSLRLGILKSASLKAAGEDHKAVAQMEYMLRLAVPRGFVQCFLDEGMEVLTLVRRAASAIRERTSTANWTCFEAALERAMISGSPHSINVPSARQSSVSATLEELTGREAEILRVLEKGLTNREIAQFFSLSENTVKWHLRNIFDKLGVGNRTEAVFLLRNDGI